MNGLRKNKARQAYARHIILILFVLSGIVISLFYIPLFPTSTKEKVTTGKITFLDFNSNPLMGTIKISGMGITGGQRENINSIVWVEVPNAIIDFNAIDKKGISLNFRIDGNSSYGIVMLDDFGPDRPNMNDLPAPGETIKYMEIRTLNVSFKDANITFLYSDANLENIDENNLTIYIFDNDKKEWKELAASVDTNNKTITAIVDIMSVFAVGTHMSGIPPYIIENRGAYRKTDGSNLTLEEMLAGSKYAFTGMQLHDSKNRSVKARYRTFDEEENLVKEGSSDIISTAEILNRGVVEVDALETRNISVKLKIHSAGRGKLTLDDFGRKDPVSVPVPGKPVKYVEIGASDINFSYAEITIKYTDDEIKGLNEDNLAIFHWNGTVWEPLLTVVDAQNNTLTANSTSLSPFGVSETVVYRWIPNTGTTVATGVTTNWASCGSEPGTYSKSLLTNASTSGCSNDRQDGIARDPAVDLFFNYNYIVNMNVNGNWYYGRLRDGGSGGGTFTFKLIYIYPNGTIVALPGSGSQSITSGQSVFANVSLAGISGVVPAGTKLGLRISKSGSSSDLRVYFGDSVGTGVKSGYFSMTDSVAATFYNLSGYVINESSGLPLSSATVSTNTSITNVTDSNGFYNLNLVNGTYSITTSLANYFSNTTTVTISGNNIDNSNISLTPMPTYQVSGYALNKSSYEFLSGVNITTNTGLNVTTDADGYYSLSAANGTIIVSARKSGYGTESVTRSVEGDALYDVNFELTPIAKIIVSVNRYVINDDPVSTKKTAQTSANFSLPWSGVSSWNLNEWNGNQTQITGYALLLDQYGAPIKNTSVSFTFRNWNNSTITILPDTDTDSNGIANVTYDMDGLDYYGNWYVDANVSDKTDTTGFIYNWWGCNSGGCTNHGSNSPGTATPSKQDSPYMLGRESIIANSNHGTAQNDNNCVGCHRSYDGKGGGANFAGQTTKTSDVHTTNTCSTCHAGYATHGTDEPIKSCSDCHTRTDLSQKSTMPGSPPVSNYSGIIAARGHNYNFTIPCIICHGPMHNITKPDRSIRFTRNNDTEPTHCMTCHTSYQKHNNSVNCTLCHSDDIHVVQIFSQDAAYVTLNKANPNTYRGNCTSCHQNQTFYSALKSNSKAGIQSGNNPAFIGTSLEHSDDHLSGGKYNNYWTPLDPYSACKYCHTNPQHSTNALGPPSSFKGTNTVNSTIGNTSWCLACHYPNYANYSDMVSRYTIVPPSIIKNSTYFLGGRDHSIMSYFNDTACYLCHNGSNLYTTMNQFMHGVYVGGGGPDCLKCHDTGRTETYMHVNNTAMKQSFHANLNNQSVNSSNVSADNKKCWGCHQSDGSQPTGDSMGDKYTKPYTCDECHLITAEPYANVSNAHRVTNHIWLDSPFTKIVTYNATCSTCHNNSVKTSYITDTRTLSKDENVSHYGTLTYIIDSVGDTNPSQGCVYCHLNNTNRDIWGKATDPRLSVVQPHTQTTNAQCYECHMETTTLVDNLHNSSMFYAGAGKVIFATDKYIVLDDPKIAGAKADTWNGFRLPYLDYANWNYWSGKNTRINVAALYFDRYGVPMSGSLVNFTMYYPNGTVHTTDSNTTDVNGQANFSYDMNGANYYGIWKIMASTRISSVTVSSNITFIYNWWGCSYNSGQCNENHGGKNPGSRGITTANSPSLSGRDTLTGVGDHSGTYNCTFCHQSYDGMPGGTNPVANDPNHLNKPADVHRNILCDNVSCHGTKTTHDTNQLIYSCFTANCHSRTDISGKSTLSSGTVSTALSLYSYNFGGSTNARYHTPNSTVPCFVCHGPMHAITKPDSTLRFVKNNETEYTQCTTCHMDYVRHNRSVGCSVCHSDDVHSIKVFAQNASFTTLNHDNPNPSRGNCTNCHQNSTFFASLLSQPYGGNYTENSPVQVASPVEHSNDPASGQKWNQTPGYWTISSQVTWCYYCHTNQTHSAKILGRVSLFNGNNTVNSSISASSSWCASCHWQNYTNGSNSYSDMTGTFLASFKVVPPEISGNPAYGANQSNYEYTNHSLYPKDDASCNICHGYKYGFTGITQLMHNLSDVGGPNCVECHDTGGLALLAHVNVSATNDTNAVHKNLNSPANSSNGSAYYANNKRCWFCHSDDGAEPTTLNAHPSRYKTPRRCPDCHLPTSMGGSNHNNDITGCNCHFTIPTLRAHLWNGINIATPGVTTCYACHNKSEMLISANDPDNGTGLVYGGENGGNSSPNHYGKKRTDLIVNGNVDCLYCHRNTSTVFASAMIDPVYNTSISNHSIRYNSSNPACTDARCHSTGNLHNSTLTKPALTLPGSVVCLSCHGNNGSNATNYTGAVTGIKAKHNDTINCTECHLNSSKDIHPVKYLQPNASFGTNNSTGVNCISCHQSSTVFSGLTQSPPKIANPIYHSNNASNGTAWNTTGYWISSSPITSCLYCHNDTKHNATALGRPSSWKGNNTVNSSISTGFWCSSCHYRGYSSGGKTYDNMTSVFISSNLSVPPEITNGTYAPYNLSRYYNHSLTNYSDATCWLCHGTNISLNAGISSFMHNFTWGTCISCHYSFEAMNSTNHPQRFVDSEMYNYSLHRSLTCQNCHTKGHKNIGARKACEDCHVVQTNPITDKDRHDITAIPSTNMYGGDSVVNITDCTICHNSALYNNSINTYGYGKPKDCDYCHTYPDKYYE